MKRKALTVLLGASLAAAAVSGCGSENREDNEQTVVVSDMEIVEEETESEPETETETEPQTESMSLDLQEESGAEAGIQTESDVLLESETEEETAAGDSMRPSLQGTDHRAFGTERKWKDHFDQTDQ